MRLSDGLFFAFAHARRIVLRREIARRRADAAAGASPFGPLDLPRPLPRRLWMYWAQGEAQAPALVRRCIESWRSENPGWRLIVIDRESEAAHADMSDIPEALSLAHRADILRLRLLREHGGVWADATCLCHKPLDGWLPPLTNAGFFAFHRPGPDRLLANWFLAAAPGDPLVAAWERAAAGYWRRHPRRRTFYFATHYAFEWAVRRDRALRARWDAVPKLPAAGPLALEAALGGASARRADAVAAIAGGAPMSKLTHKKPVDAAMVESVLAEARAARVG